MTILLALLAVLVRQETFDVWFYYQNSAARQHAIARFDVKVDETYIDVGLPEKGDDPRAPTGYSAYHARVPMSAGTHQVAVRACSTRMTLAGVQERCSVDSGPLIVELP